MSLEMIANELSLKTPAYDMQTAQQWMGQFVQTLRSLVTLGTDRVLRVPADYQTTPLAFGYTLVHWFGDNQVDKEERRWFRSLSTRSPFLEGLPDWEDEAWKSEFFFNGNPSMGLGYAFLLNAIAVSWSSDQQWDNNQLEIEHNQLKDDQRIDHEMVLVPHCSHPNHALAHQTRITQQLTATIQSPIDLWNRRDSLFPSLNFCNKVESQLLSIDAGDAIFPQVVKCLLEFQDYCNNWQTESFNSATFALIARKSSPDSDATLRQYGKERTFLYNGVSFIFSLHVRIPLRGWRVYFHPEPNTHTLLIGYIGRHLPTVLFPA
ncbi:MAG: hypothetical protein HOP19_13070 [Acidobacteria bacterium]|nr:hypothetical protein [Acidobacteriota bacterium]